MTPEQKSPPTTAPARPVAVPEPVEIAVAHHPEDLPPVTFHGPQAPPVDVRIDGDIHLVWGEESSRELRFRIADDSPDAVIVGFELGWPGSAAGGQGLRFELACETAPDGRRRALRLTTYPSREELPYTLVVRGGGKTYRLDPKIYNQGDGGPPGSRG